MSSSALRIEGVSKSFGRLEVLKGIDLEIGSGEFFSLLGPSGCGKTTLLNILGGLEAPSQGRIVIEGQDVTHLPPERRPTNMVFQSYAIFPHLSVGRNLAYGLRRRRLPKGEVDRRVARMLDLVHLDGMVDRDPAELSGGQRQRVALARALILEPKVLLLDESLAALDRRLREAMQVELRQLQRTVGITFVFVTHDQDEAMAMSDRIAVMGEGRVLQVADPARLYHEPNCRAVAEFIGSINLFPIHRVEDIADGLLLEGGPLGAFRLPRRAGELPGRDGLMLAVRPEAIEIVSEKPDDGLNALPGRIVESVFLGDRSFLRVAVPEWAHPVVAACPPGRLSELREAQNVWLTWKPESGRLLTSR
ncbi:MAG TPA: ABC transporter ATP-binding protein [Mesorhizobium sp.]|jgi:spermidine/putrescine transport system ATP-binding protein/putrescine transport system ATP-binding protein|nr:ABC transporter ATP-binding protein [Mesorhizobium sp.]